MEGISETTFWAVLIPVVAIVGGFVLAGLGIYSGIRRREFEHRERLAMIEKGLAPPDHPASEAFPLERLNTILSMRPAIEERSRRAGFVLMAIGFGMAFLIWMTSHEVDAAMGIGGFLFILGGAIFLSSFFGGRVDRGAPGPPGNPRR